MAENDRLQRTKQRALIKRDAAISQIQSIYTVGIEASNDPLLIPKFLSSASDLDTVCAQFSIENNALLDAMLDLGISNEFSNVVELEFRQTVYSIRALVSQLSANSVLASSSGNLSTPAVATSSVEPDKVAMGLSPAGGSLSEPQGPSNIVPSSNVRLPEIPLPTFDGRLQNWPDFRDRFVTLVDSKPNISKIEKFYYLLGCLQPGPSDVVKGITVSDKTYDIAWAALVNSYDKPRQLAMSLINELLSAPVNNQESVSALTDFLSKVSDNILLLQSLEIPDLGAFLLFVISVRCLPATSRRLFEQNNTSEFPSVDGLISFVKDRIQVLENAGAFSLAPVAKSLPKTAIQIKHKSSSSSTRPVTSLVANKSVEKRNKCYCCDAEHSLAACPIFKEATIDDRYAVLSKHRLCMVCFSENHWASKCRSSCLLCHGKHNKLLHRDDSHSKKRSTSTLATSLISLQSVKSVLLGTAIVSVQDVGGQLHSVRAVIDSASQISIITSQCLERLGLRLEHRTVPVSGLASQQVSSVKGVTKLCLHHPDPNMAAMQIRAFVLPTITGQMPSVPVPEYVRQRCSGFKLADSMFDTPAPVDLLLGADVFSQVWCGERQDLGVGLPTAFNTIFGWVLLGPVCQISPKESDQVLAVSLVATSLESVMGRFWQLEEPEEAPVTFTEDGKCEYIFKNEVYNEKSGRFVVPLPFRTSPHVGMFQGARSMAISRFEKLEVKLLRNPALYEAYKQFMADYESLGHMSLATTPGSYFIPHHAVSKLVGDTLKLRVVFDASARPPSEKSLNEVLHVGPKLQQDLVDILLGFRLHRYAFTCDICKMYRQVLLDPAHRQFQHIFWRASPHDKLQEFELNTITYGLACAPYLALRVLKEIASIHASNFPDVQMVLCTQTYMDDICTGANTIEQAEVLQQDLIRILSQYGLELKKWAANSPLLLKKIPSEDQAIDPLAFQDGSSAEVQVLGLKWDPDGDIFLYNVNSKKVVSSKRSVLSLIARIFDPLGFLSPVIFYAKHLMQEVWQSGVSWDEPLPIDLENTWFSFVSELSSLSSIAVPRFVGFGVKGHYELCGFCDASTRGYAAMVYLRVTDTNGKVSLYLLGSKTKLAPIKSMSIPRLELCAAGLLARWLRRISEVLSRVLIINSVYAWTDSSVVLTWLTMTHVTYKVFVSNRIFQIRQLIPNCQWFHVSSDMNPADCASRGLRPSELAHCSLYWQGPSFLYQLGEGWKTSFSLIPEDQLPEITQSTLAVQCTGETDDWLTKFSSFNRLLRVVAWMRRFISLCRKQSLAGQVLSYFELKEALIVVVKYAQRRSLMSLFLELTEQRTVSSRPLARLCPFLDARGIIRVGGRLRHSDLSDRRKYPMLLSKDSHLAVLVARHWHLFGCHASPRLMSALICRQFWITAVRLVIRRIIRECVICVRLAAVNPQPIMADLPACRVQQSRPFSNVGVDYAGPLIMKELNLRKSRQYKVYIAVFVCMCIKAVHLEVVTDLSTNAFLAAFDRFVARRGLPATVFSDCGTNFVGASKQLYNLVNHPNNRDIITAHSTCNWVFNPPSAPHFGGIWEAAVRSTKRLLIRVVGTQTLTLEELITIICRIESALNSRPLCASFNDPNDPEPLTPGHFLIGQPLMAVPQEEVPVSSANPRQRWKLLHQLFQSFWRRWAQEYLSTLQSRGRWAVQQENVKIGDVVVVKDNLSSPLVWPLGIIQELLPGPDGVVRVVKVKTKQGLFIRPVVKLVPLPID